MCNDALACLDPIALSPWSTAVKQTRHLRLEQLEDRCTPTTFGNPWPDASHLTLSFAPDGTLIGPYQNQLAQLFNTQVSASSAVWQRTILRAFQTWAVNANVNLTVVADGGQAFGTGGAPQGDARFG